MKGRLDVVKLGNSAAWATAGEGLCDFKCPCVGYYLPLSCSVIYLTPEHPVMEAIKLLCNKKKLQHSQEHPYPAPLNIWLGGWLHRCTRVGKIRCEVIRIGGGEGQVETFYSTLSI